jgi:hypothetical protein
MVASPTQCRRRRCSFSRQRAKPRALAKGIFKVVKNGDNSKETDALEKKLRTRHFTQPIFVVSHLLRNATKGPRNPAAY